VESIDDAKRHLHKVARDQREARAEKFWQQTVTAGSAVQQASEAQREEKEQTPSRKLKP
jgi:hypothetical protein